MTRRTEQSYKVQNKKERKILWDKKFEYSADTKKLKKWMKDHKYSTRALREASGMGIQKSEYIYAKGNFTLYEAKKLAVHVGMSLYDFIDIFLSDIYPVTPEDFDILSDEDEL